MTFGHYIFIIIIIIVLLYIYITFEHYIFNTDLQIHCAYLINLKKRSDRKKLFFNKYNKNKLDLLFNNLIVFKAIDGTQINIPSYWFKYDTYKNIYKDLSATGTYGCYKSHYDLLSKLQKNNSKNIVILEDDADFIDNFTNKFKLFVKNIPKNWDVVLLGFTNNSKPIPINEFCDKTVSANTTIGYIINSKGIHLYLNHLNNTKKIDSWLCNEPIDCQLSRIQNKMNVYQPKSPLVIPSILSQISNIYKP